MPIPSRLKITRPTPEAIAIMSELCDQIETALERGEQADRLLAKWHEHSGRRTERQEFQTYWKAVSKEEFVLEALNPPPRFDAELTFDEAAAVIGSLEEGCLDEHETSYYLVWLEAQFGDVRISDLIYWPDEWFGDASLFRDKGGAFLPEAELSSEVIVGYAMAKSGRKLAGAPGDLHLPHPLPDD